MYAIFPSWFNFNFLTTEEHVDFGEAALIFARKSQGAFQGGGVHAEIISGENEEPGACENQVSFLAANL